MLTLCLPDNLQNKQPREVKNSTERTGFIGFQLLLSVISINLKKDVGSSCDMKIYYAIDQ